MWALTEVTVAFIALMLLVGWQEGHLALHGYLSGARYE